MRLVGPREPKEKEDEDSLQGSGKAMPELGFER